MKDKAQSVLIVDCGTLTRAILFEDEGQGYHPVARGTSKTTIDPEGDVTLGVLAAARQIEEAVGRQLVYPEQTRGIMTPRQPDGSGVDMLLLTSSVGGGLQMMVAGLVRIMTADSAERAALGAGASVLDVIAIDDGRMPHEHIQRIRELKPDVFLLSGGVDGGNEDDVLEFAREVAQAKLPRLPVIYAGNKDAREEAEQILRTSCDLHIVDNLRPVLEDEILEPARQKIHELFMQHVVAKTPGFDKLTKWASRPVMPSTGAVSTLVEVASSRSATAMVGVNLGGTTTDVYSAFKGRFTRTVSADVGLGYSISNVLVKAGYSRLARWLPFEISAGELQNRLRNRMVNPDCGTTSEEDRLIELAVAREAIRMAFDQHRRRVTGLRGVRQQRDISNVFDQTSTGDSLVNMTELQLIMGSGSIFSSLSNEQAAVILLDALRPEGITRLAVDYGYSAPHFGILTAIDQEAGYLAFERDGLLHLGTSICAMGRGQPGEPCLALALEIAGGDSVERNVTWGAVEFVAMDGSAQATILPTSNCDLGKGYGQKITMPVTGGALGLIIDTRGRVRR